MKHIGVIGFCFALVWATPLQKVQSKTVPLKNIGPRIINGEEAALGQIPWQAGLYFLGNNITYWFCGGSVISQEWILTAAHCLVEVQEGYAFTGLVDLNNLDVGVSTDVSYFVLHPNYNATTLDNDIGLVKIKVPLKFDENQAPIALSEDFLEDGTDVTLSGWGVLNDEGDTETANLNYVNLVVISNNECNEYYEDFVTDNMVCASSGTSTVKGPCNGDNGGPVVINATTNPVLVAIVSFISDQGCESNLPSGYIRTASYRDWIREETGV
jgi:secreted trypsin-like serine protease